MSNSTLPVEKLRLQPPPLPELAKGLLVGRKDPGKMVCCGGGEGRGSCSNKKGGFSHVFAQGSILLLVRHRWMCERSPINVYSLHVHSVSFLRWAVYNVVNNSDQRPPACANLLRLARVPSPCILLTTSFHFACRAGFSACVPN